MRYLNDASVEHSVARRHVSAFNGVIEMSFLLGERRRETLDERRLQTSGG